MSKKERKKKQEECYEGLIVKQNRITKANPHNHTPDPADAIIQMYVSNVGKHFKYKGNYCKYNEQSC